MGIKISSIIKTEIFQKETVSKTKIIQNEK